MGNLLIISNNVLSYTNNNGKTMYSFVKGLNDVSVSQLYFSGEEPRINGYSYYRISDKSIIKGIFNSRNRGNIVFPNENKGGKDDFSIKKIVGRNKYTLFVRELLWHNKWKSSKLYEWLDSVNPDAILFVAGDAIFAYDICMTIQKRYNSRLTVYVTDDYVMPRENESYLEKKRRNIIKHRLSDILRVSKCFYTISQPMQNAYKKLFNKDSFLAVNMAADLKNDKVQKLKKDAILLYTGSFYYGRDRVLKELAISIRDYNKKYNKKAKLLMYSSREPSGETQKTICVSEASEYGGSLSSEQLKMCLNKADILVFVESFDSNQIEKVKYSLSTKVPEYLSVGKPILALGPDGVGSMEYLKDVAMCVNDPSRIYENISHLLNDKILQNRYGEKSRNKYLNNYNLQKLQKEFAHNVMGC